MFIKHGSGVALIKFYKKTENTMYEKYPEQAGDIEPQTSPLNVTGATNFQLSVKQFILGLVQLAHPS